MNIFAKRFKLLRDKNNWTQEYVAQKLGVRRPTIAGYESEDKGRIPRRPILNKIADLYGVSVDYLLGHDTQEGNKSWHPSSSQVRWLPVVAEIACGEPAFTEDGIIGALPAETQLLNGGEYVWLQAKGDSMINANIKSGDRVLIRLQPEVENGEIAAVSVDGENATLKRVFFQDGLVVLKPENDTLAPWSYETSRIRVVGKVVMITTYLMKR